MPKKHKQRFEHERGESISSFSDVIKEVWEKEEEGWELVFTIEHCGQYYSFFKRPV